MPVVPGKPGSKRVRGQIRAQAEATRKKLVSIIAYNDKLKAKVPPVELLTDDARAILTAARVECVILLASMNN